MISRPGRRIAAAALTAFLWGAPARAADYFALYPDLAENAQRYFILFDRSPQVSPAREAIAAVMDSYFGTPYNDPALRAPVNGKVPTVVRRSEGARIERVLAASGFKALSRTKGNPVYEIVDFKYDRRFYRSFFCNLRYDDDLGLPAIPTVTALKKLDPNAPPPWLYNGTDASGQTTWFAANRAHIEQAGPFFYDDAARVVCAPLDRGAVVGDKVAYASLDYTLTALFDRDENAGRGLHFAYNMAPILAGVGVGSVVYRLGALALGTTGISETAVVFGALGASLAAGIAVTGPTERLAKFIDHLKIDYADNAAEHAPDSMLWRMVAALNDPANRTKAWSASSHRSGSAYTDYAVAQGSASDLDSGTVYLRPENNVVNIAMRYREMYRDAKIQKTAVSSTDGIPHFVYSKAVPYTFKNPNAAPPGVGTGSGAPSGSQTLQSN